MIIKYSPNVLKQFAGIAFYNRVNILLMTLVAASATIQKMFDTELGYQGFTLPVVPVSILGGALAIFLGFRNNSAYDRWWEARKIWGGIVNASRTFASDILAFGSTHFNGSNTEREVETWQHAMVHRHIAWLYALKMNLRKETNWEVLKDHMSDSDFDKVKDLRNKPTQILNLQNAEMKNGYEQGTIDNFRHMELAFLTKEFYALQGMAERIKNTVFPYYYNYFTVVFLWLFIVCLPFALVEDMGWGAIPMAIAVSFVFTILEKSGSVTEDPFESRAADTPMSSIVRTIEIDLLEMLGSPEVPSPTKTEVSKFGVEYMT